MIRVVTYNVSGGLDVVAAGAVLAELRPDIVCVLERPGGGRLRSLARRDDREVAVRTGRRGTGTAILVGSDIRVRPWTTVPLTVPREVPQREASQAVVDVRGPRLGVVAVQLGLRREVHRTNLGGLRGSLDALVDHALRVLACHVPTHVPVVVASHHRPVVADLPLPDEESP